MKDHEEGSGSKNPKMRTALETFFVGGGGYEQKPASCKEGALSPLRRKNSVSRAATLSDRKPKEARSTVIYEQVQLSITNT